MLQVKFDVAVEPKDHDDSPLQGPVDQTSDVGDMVLDDLSVERVFTGSNFFESAVEDFRNMAVGFKSHY